MDPGQRDREKDQGQGALRHRGTQGPESLLGQMRASLAVMLLLHA